MKNKPLFLLLATMMVAISFVSCKDDDKNDDNSAEFTLAKESFTYNYKGGGDTVIVNIDVNADITATSDQSWLTITKNNSLVNSKTKQAFVVNCAENTTTDTRTAIVTFTSGSNSKQATVTQTGKASVPNTSDEVLGKTAMEIAPMMYPGWNLGNTMEAGDAAKNWGNAGINTETAWQTTKTTQEIISFVKSQGFKSVRIPCSWIMGHVTDANNLTIDPNWIERVKEVVNYCIKEGMYVLLNDHWDGGWIEVDGFTTTQGSYSKPSDAIVEEKIKTLKNLWTIIANEFKDYDQHLLFAGLNEPFQQYTLFNDKHEELTPILEKYNQAFVDAVRATGGNNKERILVVQAPGANISSAVKYLTMPTDTDKNHLMLEAHFYDPYDFTINENGTVYYWGNGNHQSSNNATYGEESYVKSEMESLRKNFCDKGYPVLIGEFAANRRTLSSVSGANQDAHDKSVELWHKVVTQYSIENGCVPFYWDTNAQNQSLEGCGTIINRKTLTIMNEMSLKGIKEGTAAATWMK